MKEESEVIYTLEKSFNYSYKGDTREAEFITLLPPTMKQHNQAASLKQSIMKIVQNIIKDEKPKGSNPTAEQKDDENAESTDDEITREMIVGAIYGSMVVDANVVWEQAKDLFKQGVILIDGEQKITTPLFDKMHPNDFEQMVGEYVVNFTIA